MDLDFIESTVQKLPQEILKSSTVETLISQNEDLMLKLKTTLRRLSGLEEENKVLIAGQLEQKRQNLLLSDQISVLKEKDQTLKLKAERAEKEKLIIEEKYNQVFALNEKLRNSVLRYEKYHEKIKVQVKPYISELKDYTANLENQNLSLKKDHDNKEALIRDLKFQILELAKNSQTQIQEQEERLDATIKAYETSIQEQNQTIADLQFKLSEAETKLVKYHRVQEKMDRLENDFIELQRSKEQRIAEYEAEILRLQNKSNEEYRKIAAIQTENADIKEKLEKFTIENRSLSQNRLDLNQQLESLRYIFSQKNAECEKLRLAADSLEKLNLELSQKIQEMRSNTNYPTSTQNYP